MLTSRHLLCLSALWLAIACEAPQDAQTDIDPFETVTAPEGSPVARHGALSVEGNKIVGTHGAPVSLAGVSFFWSTTGWDQEGYYTPETVAYFAEDWKASLVRAAISAERQGSYLTDPRGNRARAYAIIEGALTEGVYVLVDWHSHHAEEAPEAAVEFFRDIATRYGEHPNLIYEIYNEPLNTTDWAETIKPYSELLIEEIRAIDPDNLIVVGTQSWSQDVDKAAADPVAGDNLVYALHFYSGSHKEDLRARAQTALDMGLPIMVTEWGTVNYDGDGPVDEDSVTEWMDFIRENDLSHANWSVSNKAEGASIFKSGTSFDGPWTEADLTASGLYVREIVRGWED
ncbi:MAG: glycoside hydrolase family 5 protein [Hyphomonadaceae bacterium]|nr:glycoside hydrolase family 5 protein [Hyphomonadaceae bacterium]